MTFCSGKPSNSRYMQYTYCSLLSPTTSCTGVTLWTYSIAACRRSSMSGSRLCPSFFMNEVFSVRVMPSDTGREAGWGVGLFFPPAEIATGVRSQCLILFEAPGSLLCLRVVEGAAVFSPASLFQIRASWHRCRVVRGCRVAPVSVFWVCVSFFVVCFSLGVLF